MKDGTKVLLGLLAVAFSLALLAGTIHQQVETDYAACVKLWDAESALRASRVCLPNRK